MLYFLIKWDSRVSFFSWFRQEVNSTWYSEIEEPIKSRKKHYFILVVYINVNMHDRSSGAWNRVKRTTMGSNLSDLPVLFHVLGQSTFSTASYSLLRGFKFRYRRCNGELVVVRRISWITSHSTRLSEIIVLCSRLIERFRFLVVRPFGMPHTSR